ncbi:MAG: response regulator transcription factor [Acidobacteria bacterium]|nr:response regulator transcription factor [Acidobacteriota bacterium]
MRVLVVEDDPEISRFIVRGLSEERHLVDLVEDGRSAVDLAAAEEYDVVVLDLMLPGLDGFDVCRQMRARGVDTPVIVVTARDGVTDRVTALDAGADDVLVKPFVFDELLARLRAVGRRGRTRHLTHLLEYAGITIDPVAHTVSVSGRPVTLTATEYRLLTFLVRRAEAVVTRDQLAQHVWGGDYDPLSNNADVYVGYVRRKLLALSPEPLIHTVRGLGYMLKAGAQS